MKLHKIYTFFFIAAIFIFSYHELQSQSVDGIFPLSGKLSSIELLDVNQNKKVKLSISGKRLSLFIFLSPECPLCQNYTKALNELHEKFRHQISLAGIIPGEAYTIKDIADFENKYHTNFSILIDPKKQLTRYLKATVTPQAVLVDNKGTLVYAGAIDDWLPAQGKKKLKVSQKYVQDAIEQSLRGELVKTKKTNAFGCKINDY